MIAAFCWPQSAQRGEAIELYCHTSADHFQFEVIRQGAADKTVLKRGNIPGRRQNLGNDIAAEGCRWDASLQLPIDSA